MDEAPAARGRGVLRLPRGAGERRLKRRPAPRLARRIFYRLVLVAGVVALTILLWKLDARTVLAIVWQVGWSIVLVIGQEVVPLALNAFGWRLSFAPEDARSYPFAELLRLWLAMDGVNYLIPTGTIAGEVARATMLNEVRLPEVRAASVVVSRLGQTIAQLMFALAGFVFLVSRIPAVRAHPWITATAACLLGLVVALLAAYLLFAGRLIRSGNDAPPATVTPDRWFREMPRQLRSYFGRHRGRFVGSVGVFAAAYAWITLETWWICRSIGVPVTFRTALTIEVLSVTIDGVLFMVPAKIGTQELGKTAIFSLLGLPLRFGLAFGIVRHIREVVWAVTGFLMYSTMQRAAGRTAASGSR